mgnify:CR=1 FL=1
MQIDIVLLTQLGIESIALLKIVKSLEGYCIIQ